jgi:hypothetical protein
MEQPNIILTDITESFREKEDQRTLLQFDEAGISPIFAKEIRAAYVLMEWPLLQDSKVLRSYALLLPHGGIHVAEVFFFRQGLGDFLTGEFLGSSHIFSIQLPDNQYSEAYDDTISASLWRQVGGNGLD